ncbi:MarR family winged helix-turn-helix transcriptional regulator [Amycolatopsis sp. WGS_07]|uniref:MarR family winged helix-turn-helix transcriptional regulator n=1 Tax=Amycolatopsis sp. WGS_07 TaxID=3076764 RepID=UPI003872A7EF
MGVEERIAEKLDPRLGNHLKRAEVALMAEKGRVLKPFGLSVPQYAAMHALSVAPLSGAQLARVCCVTPQSMTSMLSTLESKNLVERTPSEVHAQVLIARLTRSGHAVFRKANEAALAVEARLSAEFEPEEEELLRALLARAVKVLGEGG